MNLSAVQRFCTEIWLGKKKRTNQMLRVLSHILPKKVFTKLCAGLVDRVPNFLNKNYKRLYIERTHLTSKQIQACQNDNH